MEVNGKSTSQESKMRLLNDPTVTLRCGDASFIVHRKLVCQASPFFKSAFTGDGEYVEASTQSMDLSGTEVTIDDLDCFVEWLYTGTYKLTTVSCKESTQKQYMELATLFVFAEKYFVSDLKNDIVDKLFDLRLKQRNPPQIPVVKYVYENTPTSSPFRRLMVTHYVFHIDLAWYDDDDTPNELDGTSDFAMDLAIQLGRRLRKPSTAKSLFDGKPSDLYASKSIDNEGKGIEK